MAIADPAPAGHWLLSVEPVGDPATLLARLNARAGAHPVALGLDVPIGLPRAYAAAHAAHLPGFPAFLNALRGHPGFFTAADTLAEVGPLRPFYPRRGQRGMTRLSLATALGLTAAADLSRRCDRATPNRPAGAPLFWTLGANQSGKAGLSAWHDLLLPALATPDPPALWPFEGPFRHLVATRSATIAETYPADSMRQLGIAPHGSKRRQADRMHTLPHLRAAMAALHARPGPALAALMEAGFGTDPAGEDRFDCLLGVLNVLLVIAGRRPDTPPADPWLTSWEGWVLGQLT